MNNPTHTCVLFYIITHNLLTTDDSTSREPCLTSGHVFYEKRSVWQDERELANFTAINVL